MTEPKSLIVPPTTVTFAPSAMQADTLDAAVAKSSVVQHVPELSWEEVRENMAYVKNGLAEVLGKSYNAELHMQECYFSAEEKELLPYVASLTKTKNSHQPPYKRIWDMLVEILTQEVSRLNPHAPNGYRLFFNKIPWKTLKSLLHTAFGEEICHTKIYKKITDDALEVGIADLAEYFSECRHLQQYEGKVFSYGFPHGIGGILTFPLQIRSFFAGVLRSVDAAKKRNLPLEQLFSTRDVLTYAKKVNQLDHVDYYLEQLNKSK